MEQHPGREKQVNLFYGSLQAEKRNICDRKSNFGIT
jgi:hypothetical protein